MWITAVGGVQVAPSLSVSVKVFEEPSGLDRECSAHAASSLVPCEEHTHRCQNISLETQESVTFASHFLLLKASEVEAAFHVVLPKTELAHLSQS